jgi:RNA polymerase sigma-70 factor (ECF subfamily)
MLSVTAEPRSLASRAPSSAASLLWRYLRALAAVFSLGGQDAPPPVSPVRADGAEPAAIGHSGRADGPDTRAFDLFFAEHEQPLYGFLRRMVSSDEVALELAQESFFRAWQHFDEVSAYDRPGAWLFRIATNLAISHLRRRWPAPFADLASERDDDTLAEERFADPSDFASDSAERDAIGRVLRQLPERQRAALLLRAVHGLSCDEIAQALGLSSVAARKLLSRGRERFRALYLGDSADTSHATDADAPIQGGKR